MYRFFAEDEINSGQDIIISGEDYNHIKNVLRMKPGEQVLVSDGNDREYLCSIREITQDSPKNQPDEHTWLTDLTNIYKIY